MMAEEKLKMTKASKVNIFLDAMHYGSPSGGGGWHSLYNLIGEAHKQRYDHYIQHAVCHREEEKKFRDLKR